MSAIPATRSLPAVLRAALDAAPPLRILAGTYAPDQPAGLRYVNVILSGTTLTLPNLNAMPAYPGQVAYVLSDGTRMFVLGTVRSS